MDMHNWDMVCAVACSRLNDRLKAEVHKNLGTFSFADSDGNRISGEFGGWEIVPGGDAQRINLITPVSAGSLIMAGAGDKTISVDGLRPKLQVELAFVSAGGASHCQLNNTSPSIRFSLDADMTFRVKPEPLFFTIFFLGLIP